MKKTDKAAAFDTTDEVTFNPAAALLRATIDVTAELREPPGLLFCDGKAIATLGSFSLLIGKAKSRKTFSVAALTAAAACGHSSIGIITGRVRAANQILYFDTEQSEYHAQRSAKRICRQMDIAVPTNIRFVGLRPFTPDERRQIIAHAIENTPDLAMVVIDGIADLLSCGINDEPEAIELTTTLMKWTQQYNIHIITVLHQNKGDFNARGHIGTYLVNKAETVLSVTKDTKDQQVSIVRAEYSRDMDIKDFAFTIDENGLPVLAEKSEPDSRKTVKRGENFNYILPGIHGMKYTELCQAYSEIAAVAIPTAKTHISEATKAGMLINDNGTYRINRNISDETAPF